MEKIKTNIFKDVQDGSLYAAKEVIKLIKKRNQAQQKTILGLATGASPVKFYTELIQLHKSENVSFKNVYTFNLDEYFPMDKNAIQSYHHFMYENLFKHIDIPTENIHIPNGSIDLDQVEDFCKQYEEKIEALGGVDIQILGIGRTGHIGFNEPGSSPISKTRLVTLDKKTRTDNAKDFTSEENVPKRAITMGVGTILKAKKIYLFAWGDKKAEIVKEAVEGEINWNVPATFLQNHNDCLFILDDAAATELTKVKSPWLLGECAWNKELTIKAVCWLALKLNKPVLKLTDEDYNQNGLGDLVAKSGNAYESNLFIFNNLRDTITGWPGGKPGTQDENRPERAEPFPKRVLVFSPHPDDDVVGMGGTLIRLVDQGHDVHVAYQTTGAYSVMDEDVLTQINLFAELSGLLETNEQKAYDCSVELKKYLQTKIINPEKVETIHKIKGLIRKAESASATRFCGINGSNLHFLNLAFYNRNSVSKSPFEQNDVEKVKSLLQVRKPHQIFISADIVNPQGTKRMCFDIVLQALNELRNEKWTKDCWLWLYHGAEQEWAVNEIQMAVPLSPDEALKKRQAILKHYSRKDGSYFTGDDNREIWRKTEDKNKNTADVYNRLGLPEYEAIECFKRYQY